MTYPDGEARILTLIRSLSGYTASNTARCDWRLLNSGNSDRYVILRPGEWSSAQLTQLGIRYDWRTVVQVWRAYRDDAQPSLIQSDVAELVAHLAPYYDLDGLANVIDVDVAGGGNLEEVSRRNDQSQWLRWEVYIDWAEEEEINYQ